MKRFQVGQKYDYSDWFTGGKVHMKVTTIKKGRATFDVCDTEADGTHNRRETHVIERTEDGEEYIVPQSYRGERCIIMASDVQDKRSKEETIALFRQYEYDYYQEARKCEKRGDSSMRCFFLGKAEAYENAAFEIETNMA